MPDPYRLHDYPHRHLDEGSWSWRLESVLRAVRDTGYPLPEIDAWSTVLLQEIEAVTDADHPDHPLTPHSVWRIGYVHDGALAWHVSFHSLPLPDGLCPMGASQDKVVAAIEARVEARVEAEAADLVRQAHAHREAGHPIGSWSRFADHLPWSVTDRALQMSAYCRTLQEVDGETP
jgi:hypothetical protein